MVGAALLEPKFCAQAWWFSHMPGSKCAFRRGETLMFASAPRPWRVAPPLASSGRFRGLSKMRKTLRPFVKKFSGLRPARQDAACAFCIVFYSSNWPQASESSGFYRVPGSGSRASQEASETAPRGQGLQEASKRPPGGLQEPPKTAEVRLLLCFTEQTCLRSKKPKVFQWF